MSRQPADVPVLVLGCAALVSSLFTFSSGGPAPVEFIHIRGAGLLLLLICGAAAVAAGALGLRWLAVGAGAGLAAAAVLQLLQADQGVNWLSGDASTVALMGGLGIGLLAISLTPRPGPSGPPVSSAQDRTAHHEPDRPT